MDFMPRILEILSFLRRNWANILLGLVFSVAAIELLSLYGSTNADDGEWERFKAERHCRPLINGRGSQRLSWQCDGGEIHYRWRQQR